MGLTRIVTVHGIGFQQADEPRDDADDQGMAVALPLQIVLGLDGFAAHAGVQLGLRVGRAQSGQPLIADAVDGLVGSGKLATNP